MNTPERGLIVSQKTSIVSIGSEAGRLLAARGLALLKQSRSLADFDGNDLIMDSPVLKLRRLVACGEIDEAFELAEEIGLGTDQAASSEALGLMLRMATSDDGFYAAKVALWYNVGRRPFVRDYAASGKWAQLSADKGNRYGEGYLAWLHDIGRGVPKDATLALRYALRSIKQGNDYSLGLAARSYHLGHGAAIDLAKAHAFLRLKCSLRDERLTEEEHQVLAVLEKGLSPGDKKRSSEILCALQLARDKISQE